MLQSIMSTYAAGMTNLPAASESIELSPSPVFSSSKEEQYVSRGHHNKSPFEWMKKPSYQNQPNPGTHPYVTRLFLYVRV